MPSYLFLFETTLSLLFFHIIYPHQLNGYSNNRLRRKFSFLNVLFFFLCNKKRNLTVGEVLTPAENLDADPLMPSIELLATQENPEVLGNSEIPASEVVSVDSEPLAKVEQDLVDTNLVNVSNNVTRNESGSSEDDIPSFSEWTLKVLAEEEKSGNYNFESHLERINT